MTRSAVLLASLSLGLVACGGGGAGNGAGKDGSVDAPPASDAPAAGTADASCFDLSTITAPTNNEIINACTDADKIYKDSHPPLEGSDGSLPPLSD